MTRPRSYIVISSDRGQRAGELLALRGSDGTRHGRRVAVHVSGPARGWCRSARLTPGGRPGWPPPRDMLTCSGPGGRAGICKNFVTNFARTLAADPAAPRLTLGRCRSSFICGHLAAGTPLAELLAITGISRAESLGRYVTGSRR